MSPALLDVRQLRTYFPVKGGLLRRTIGQVHAVEDVSFQIQEREVFALVGESGCGKSTVGKSILRLIEPTAGEVYFDGRNIAELSPQELRHQRRDMQFIFQNPYASLNPRMNVWQLLSEPLNTHFQLTREETEHRVEEMLGRIGLTTDQLLRYPHQFSGGQKQRISIGRALMTSPRFVVADEPVSALDVSIQAQILNLLIKLQQEMALAMVFISHDLNVVRFISNSVAVMYLGSIMETGPTGAVYGRPRHPYTQALLQAVPQHNPRARKKRRALQGEVPNPMHPPTGCPFHPRCPRADDLCRAEKPLLLPLADRQVACHHPLED